MAVYREDNNGVIALLLVVVVLLVGGFLFYQLGDGDDADVIEIETQDVREGFTVDEPPEEPAEER